MGFCINRVPNIDPNLFPSVLSIGTLNFASLQVSTKSHEPPSTAEGADSSTREQACRSEYLSAAPWLIIGKIVMPLIIRIRVILVIIVIIVIIVIVIVIVMVIVMVIVIRLGFRHDG